MSDLIFGRRPVLEAIRCDVPIKKILIADNIEDNGIVRDIVRDAQKARIKVEHVPKKRLDALSYNDGARQASRGRSRSDQHPGNPDRTNHQGVVAETKEFAYSSIGEVVRMANDMAAADAGQALVVICDHLTDVGNLGAIIRSAESVGACAVVIPSKRSASVTPAVYKSSAGAVSHMTICQTANLASAVEKLKAEGFWVVAATEHGDELLWDTNLKGKIALILGNEQNGVSRLLLDNADFRCKLPQMGGISSLNVAQASTVFMYEWLRQNYIAGREA